MDVPEFQTISWFDVSLYKKATVMMVRKGRTFCWIKGKKASEKMKKSVRSQMKSHYDFLAKLITIRVIRDI